MMDQMDAAEQCVSNTDGPSIAFIKHYNKNKLKRKCADSNNLMSTVTVAVFLTIVSGYKRRYNHKCNCDVLSTPQITHTDKINYHIACQSSFAIALHETRDNPPDGKLYYSSYSFG